MTVEITQTPEAKVYRLPPIALEISWQLISRKGTLHFLQLPEVWTNKVSLMSQAKLFQYLLASRNKIIQEKYINKKSPSKTTAPLSVFSFLTSQKRENNGLFNDWGSLKLILDDHINHQTKNNHH